MERREGGKQLRDGVSFTDGQVAATADKEGRRAARAIRRADGQRPQSLGTSQSGALPTVQPAGENAGAESSSDSSNGTALLNETTILSLKGMETAHTAKRVKKRQEAAASALDHLDQEAAIGALNRHLNTVTQQLTAIHRLIGRVAAERDALRRQLADVKGVPVEEIVVTTIASTPTSGPPAQHEPMHHMHGSRHEPIEPPAPMWFQHLNYFGGDDLEQMRKHRQVFVLGLAMVGGIIAVIARAMGWSMPENISRDSLSALPVLGNLMSVFLAGWVMYRIVRVASKGVRWVFPSEPRGRRRH